MSVRSACRKDRRTLGGVKASTPHTVRTLLDSASDSRRVEMQAGAEDGPSVSPKNGCFKQPRHDRSMTNTT
jgi:hypothetical protein